MIFCFEFYLFTKTSSAEVHREYLEYFLSQLKEGGEFIIHQRWENPESISSNISILKNKLGIYRFNTFRVPHAKVIKFFRIAILSQFIDKLIRFCISKDLMRALINKKIRLT